MLVILSPAKTFHKEFKQLPVKTSELFPNQTTQLLNKMQQYTEVEIKQLMSLSDALAATTAKQYMMFKTLNEASALYAFDGEVYRGLNAQTLSKEALLFSYQRLIILSGLYGMLTPTTLIKPYRLEMGLKLSVDEHPNLVNFWKPIITKALMEQLSQSKEKPVILNLASSEYAKAIDFKKIRQLTHVVEVVFKERKGDTYKVVGMYAKKARGALTRFILEHQLTEVEAIKAFEENGYTYQDELSSDSVIVFTRG